MAVNDQDENEDTIEGQTQGDTTTAQDTGNESDGDFFLSDEEFLKLSPEQYNAKMAGTASEGDDNGSGDSGDSVNGDEGNEDSSGDPEAQAQNQPNSSSGVQPSSGQAPAAKPVESAKKGNEAGDQNQSQQPKPNENPKPAANTGALPAGVTQEAMVEFYTKLTGTIKADGREIRVRSADDAVRLIQMGHNYSRRMEELKPLRALVQTLETHGLNTPERLNFAIEVMQGKPEAIQKLLADHKIDNLDLDPSKSSTYKPNNYQPNPKDMAFKEAIDATIASEGGRELITDINASWDAESKSALREQPLIFQNLLAQMQSGVYGQIKKELEYQQTLGYLVGVPFLQAYHQVGTAMQQAGAFNAPTVKTEVQPSVPAAQVPVNQRQQLAPVGTGTRKATAPKNPPAPNVSSISQPRVISNRVNEPIPTDYSGMSDAEFKKLRPPS